MDTTLSLHRGSSSLQGCKLPAEFLWTKEITEQLEVKIWLKTRVSKLQIVEVIIVYEGFNESEESWNKSVYIQHLTFYRMCQ
jgi:uncharacterized protein involved in tolerance to divalent cations